MIASLTARIAHVALAAKRRLHRTVWLIAQTSVAAGLAWYLTHDVLGHRHPFFGPIAAVVCLSATNVFRGQRAVQMIIGEVLGIGLGTWAQTLLGAGPIAIAGAVFIAMCGAMLIGHSFAGRGLIFFVNQAAVTAVLVVAFARSGLVVERLVDTTVGGGLAIVFAVLVFPANPVTLLSRARGGMLAALHHVLAEIADITGERAPLARDWPLPAVERLHQQSVMLAEARSTARHAVRFAPRRWAVRESVQNADRQAAHLALLASFVLYLARVVGLAVGDEFPESAHAAIGELAAAAAVADSDPSSAAEHAAAAHRIAADLQADGCQNLVGAAVQTCAEDLQQAIKLVHDETPSPSLVR
ncbi:MAG: FUSC family protein [Mycobacterium sp.]|nr:FUSC family protein [Mycobacterium sp.]